MHFFKIFPTLILDHGYISIRQLYYFSQIIFVGSQRYFRLYTFGRLAVSALASALRVLRCRCYRCASSGGVDLILVTLTLNQMAKHLFRN